jgi:hypothetical protein
MEPPPSRRKDLGPLEDHTGVSEFAVSGGVSYRLVEGERGA